MPLVRDRSLILQVFAYGDTSKILRLFTLQHGLRSAIAKGAQRPRSRYGGLLEPFTEGDADLYLKDGRDLQTLGGFDLVRSRQGIGRDLGAFAGASLLAEILLRYGTEEPHPELFDAATHALDVLADRSVTGDPAVRALAAVWELVSLLGYHPQLDHCVGCGRDFDPAEPTRFDVEAGGAACAHCRPSGRVVDAATRAELAAMSRAQGPPEALIDPGLHRALLRAFLGTHLAQSQPLRSLGLFTEQLR